MSKELDIDGLIRLGLPVFSEVQFQIFALRLRSLADFAQLTEDFLASEAQRARVDPIAEEEPELGSEEWEAFAIWYERLAARGECGLSAETSAEPAK